MGYRPGEAAVAELVEAARTVRPAKLVLVGDRWSRLAVQWSVTAGQVDSLLSSRRCDSDCNCRAREPRFFYF
jgi:hypothetical protein